MLASDAATVAVAARAARRPQAAAAAHCVRLANLLRSLFKLMFICGMLGEQWNNLVEVQRQKSFMSQQALFANLADVKLLLALLSTLTGLVEAAYAQLPRPDLPHEIVRGMHGASLANSVGARIDAMLVNEQARDGSLQARHSHLRNFIKQRAQTIAQSVGYVMSESGSVTSSSSAAMGLLLCATDLLPRNVGVLENDVCGLSVMSESMQQLLHVDCLTRLPLRQKWYLCVQCGRCLFVSTQYELHLAWSNCCPVCFARFVEVNESQ
jgi:hypothetical protein